MIFYKFTDRALCTRRTTKTTEKVEVKDEHWGT